MALEFARRVLLAPEADVFVAAVYDKPGGAGWGRVLADVYVNGTSYADILVEAGHGKRSRFNARMWCEDDSPPEDGS